MGTLPTRSYLRQEKNGAVLVEVHVMPNAAQTCMQGLHDGALRIRLHAPPVDGKANQALLAWVADELGVPRSAVELWRGASARRKQVRVVPPYVERARWERLTPPAA